MPLTAGGTRDGDDVGGVGMVLSDLLDQFVYGRLVVVCSHTMDERVGNVRVRRPGRQNVALGQLVGVQVCVCPRHPVAHAAINGVATRLDTLGLS